MDDRHSMARRRLLKRGALGLAGLVGASAIPWRQAGAADLPRVSLDDATAQQLMYVHDADANADAARTGGAYCYNCRYFKGDQGTEWEKCDIFPGKLVNARGWCNVYAAK